MFQIEKMVFVTDRYDIAREINILNTPVVRIDISKCMAGYDDCYEGDRVVVKKSSSHDIRCKVKMYSDQENQNYHAAPWCYPKIELMPESICLSNGFGKRDIDEMVKWRQATRLSQGQNLLVYFDKGEEGGWLRRMKVGKVTEWVYPTAILEDVGPED